VIKLNFMDFTQEVHTLMFIGRSRQNV